MIFLLGTVFGYLTARRLFVESCPCLAACVAPLLGIFAALLSGGLLLPYLSWPLWMVLTAVLFCAGSWALKRRPAVENFRAPRPLLLLYLVPALIAVLVFCWFHQAVSMVVDGDFFIHGANIGLFARGYLPPVHPFLGLPMHGHYGRDLSIAIFVRDTGVGLLTSEWVLTTIYQALSFLLLFFWLRREFDSDAVGVLGSGMAFFGMNFSAYCGLSELLANNNPVAFCLLIVIGWAIFRASRLGPTAWFAAALLLGLDAIIYETHFGVVGLSLLVLWRRPKAVLAIGLLALLTGGLLSGVVRSTARGAPENGAEQTIRMRVFKKQLFALRSDNMRPSRAFETKARPWAADFKPASDYHLIWSKPILNTFWYPVWLLPLSTLFLAWRARRPGCSEAGLWWASVAWLSLLIPALVDFGVFEAETARWLVVTALGAAIALGITLALLCSSRPSLGRPLTFLLVLICSVGLKVALGDMLQAYRHPGRPLPVGRPGLPIGNGLLPNPELALEHHYGISHEILQAAAWIREHSEPGEFFLSDAFSLPSNARGTIVGAVGLLPAMEAVPPHWARSTESYQPNLQQRGFWATGDITRLDPKVDWLLSTSPKEAFGPPLYQNGQVRVYKAPIAVPQPPDGQGAFQLDYPGQGVNGSLFSVSYKGPLGCRFQLRFLPLGDQEFVADENIQSAPAASTMTFVGPYAAGEYGVQARLSSAGPWGDLGTFTALPR